MRKRLAALGVLASWLIYPARADQVVYFSGEILNQTCIVDSGSRSLAVELPSVRKYQLNMQGRTSESTPFQIKLSGCTEGDDKPYLSFMSDTDIDMSTGNLKNTAESGAANVQVQLLFAGEQTPIMLGQPEAGKHSSRAGWVETSGETVTLKYQARYYATGPAGPGRVQAMINYMIAYE